MKSAQVFIILFAIVLLNSLNPVASVNAGSLAGQSTARSARAQLQDFTCDEVTDIPRQECEALVSLFNGLEWRNKQGWLENNQVCSWFGVTCTEGRVTKLRLEGNQFEDNQPEDDLPRPLIDLSSLTALQEIQLVSETPPKTMPQTGDELAHPNLAFIAIGFVLLALGSIMQCTGRAYWQVGKIITMKPRQWIWGGLGVGLLFVMLVIYVMFNQRQPQLDSLQTETVNQAQHVEFEAPPTKTLPPPTATPELAPTEQTPEAIQQAETDGSPESAPSTDESLPLEIPCPELPKPAKRTASASVEETAVVPPTASPSPQPSTAEEPSPSPTSITEDESPAAVNGQRPALSEAEGSAVVLEDTLTLPTYAYEQALTPLPDFPYPALDEELVGPVESRTYRTVILENDALRLTFLPELGGRLYQIHDKAIGQDILYNNPVIKPTRWGPPEMTWWLIVGGMEWAFPVEEHGYAWAMTWDIVTEITPEGAAVIKASFLDEATNLKTSVTVTLPARGRAFSISPEFSNTGDEPTAGQLWINTALPAGPEMRAELAAETVEIHSAGPDEGLVVGQIMPWEPEMGEWGLWKRWFSVFTVSFSGNSHTLWGDGSRAGLQRDFDPQTAPGLKLFTWGTETDLSEFEGRPYYEVWSGLTSNFETTVSLNPGESQGWTESWTVVSR